MANGQSGFNEARPIERDETLNTSGIGSVAGAFNEARPIERDET